MVKIRSSNRCSHISCIRYWLGWRGAAGALLLTAVYIVWVNMGQALTMQLRSDTIVMDLLGSRAEFVWSAAMATAIERSDHIIPALADRIRSDPSALIRVRAAGCCRRIAQFKPQARQSLEQIAVPALKAALSDASMLVRVSSARALWKIERNHSELLPVLIIAWRAGGRDEQYAVIETAAEMASESNEVTETVAASLDDPDPLIRQWATTTLAARHR